MRGPFLTIYASFFDNFSSIKNCYSPLSFFSENLYLDWQVKKYLIVFWLHKKNHWLNKKMRRCGNFREMVWDGAYRNWHGAVFDKKWTYGKSLKNYFVPKRGWLRMQLKTKSGVITLFLNYSAKIDVIYNVSIRYESEWLTSQEGTTLLHNHNFSDYMLAETFFRRPIESILFNLAISKLRQIQAKLSFLMSRQKQTSSKTATLETFLTRISPTSVTNTIWHLKSLRLKRARSIRFISRINEDNAIWTFCQPFIQNTTYFFMTINFLVSWS